MSISFSMSVAAATGKCLCGPVVQNTEKVAERDDGYGTWAVDIGVMMVLLR